MTRVSQQAPQDDLERALLQAYDRLEPPQPPASAVIAGARRRAGRLQRRRRAWSTAGVGAAAAALAASVLLAGGGAPLRLDSQVTGVATAPSIPNDPVSQGDRAAIEGYRQRLLQQQRYVFPEEFAPGDYDGVRLSATGTQASGDVPAMGMNCQAPGAQQALQPIAMSFTESTSSPRQLRAMVLGFTTGKGAAALQQLRDNTGYCRWPQTPESRPWAGQDAATHQLWRLQPYELNPPAGPRQGNDTDPQAQGIGPGAALAVVRVGDVLVTAAGYAENQPLAERIATRAALATADLQRRSGFPPTQGRAVPGSDETTMKDPSAEPVPVGREVISPELLPVGSELPQGWSTGAPPRAGFRGGNLAQGVCMTGGVAVGTLETCPLTGDGVPTATTFRLVTRERAGELDGAYVVVNVFPSEQQAQRAILAYTGQISAPQSGAQPGAATPGSAEMPRASWAGTDPATHFLYVAREDPRRHRSAATAVVRVGTYVVSTAAEIAWDDPRASYDEPLAPDPAAAATARDVATRLSSVTAGKVGGAS